MTAKFFSVKYLFTSKKNTNNENPLKSSFEALSLRDSRAKKIILLRLKYSHPIIQSLNDFGKYCDVLSIRNNLVSKEYNSLQ